MQRLEIRHAATLGLPETSALTMCYRPGGSPRLLAVGDEDFAVVLAEVDDGGTLVRTWRNDLSRTRPRPLGVGGDPACTNRPAHA